MKLYLALAIFIITISTLNAWIVSRISLYGNGLSFGRIHHTLIVVYYKDKEKYELLEVVKGDGGRIKINQHGNSEAEALEGRMNKKASADQWGSTESVCCPWSNIGKVVDEYNKSKYIAYSYFLFVKPKNCRTFVNKVFEECGSDRRTGIWSDIEKRSLNDNNDDDNEVYYFDDIQNQNNTKNAIERKMLLGSVMYRKSRERAKLREQKKKELAQYC